MRRSRPNSAPGALAPPNWRALADEDLAAESRLPGRSLEAMRRRLRQPRLVDLRRDAFAEAVDLVRTELVDGLLAVPFDGSVEAEQAIARFSARWTARLADGVGRHRAARPPGPATSLLAAQQWHEVQVLKFVHRRFVLRARTSPCTSAARHGC